MDADDLGALAILVVVLLVVCGLGLVGAGALAEWRTHNACTTLGYPGSRVLYPSFDAYCIKRVNQTDTIVPLSKARTQPP